MNVLHMEMPKSTTLLTHDVFTKLEHVIQKNILSPKDKKMCLHSPMRKPSIMLMCIKAYICINDESQLHLTWVTSDSEVACMISSS